MAGKKTKSELESIRGELTELTEAIYALREQVRVESAAAAAANGRSAPDGAAPKAMVPDGRENAPSIGEGEIEIRGSVRLPGQAGGGDAFSVTWATSGLTVEHLGVEATDDLAKILAAIGHRQRLAIVVAMLAGPKTAVDLVGSLGLGTTGAAYHHLNVLTGAGLVGQAERGLFSIVPERVGMVLSILASPLAPSVVTFFEADAAGVKA